MQQTSISSEVPEPFRTLALSLEFPNETEYFSPVRELIGIGAHGTEEERRNHRVKM